MATGPTRQQPNKVLSVRITSKLNLEAWPYEDFLGDPYWQGGSSSKPYRWQIKLNVILQIHGDPSTRQPYQYSGMDIFVGNWITDITKGRSVKIINVIDKTSDRATIIVEDVDRYNTFLDENGDGLFPVPSDGVIFTINDMRLPILNPLPVAGSIVFVQDVMGRFQNNNPLYRTRVMQTSHGLNDNDSIWVDPADGLYKTIANDNQLKVMVGTVDRTGPGLDVFYFIPTTKVIEGIDPPLPGTAGSLIYADALTGELTTDATDRTKVAYIQLTDSLPDTTLSTTDLVIQGSVLSVNSVDVTFSGSTMQSVVDDVNALTAQHNVTSALNAGINTASTDPVQLIYGLVASTGLTATIQLNTVTVVFNDATNGQIEFGSVVANAVDMANTINAASIPNITAIGNGSTLLRISHDQGGAIDLVNSVNDTSGSPFAGDTSSSGIPLSTAPGGVDFISFANATGAGIIFGNETGTPVFDLGLTSVRNGQLPMGLVVEQFVTEGTGSGQVPVYQTLPQLPLTGIVGEQAYVIDSEDASGNDANEWTMYLWDGFSWVQTSNEDSAATDARSLQQTVSFDDISPVSIGTLSDGRRVTQVVVEVITVFDGSPSLDIGDSLDSSRLMSNNELDLSFMGSYSSTTNFVYGTGNDTVVLATITPGGATQGLVNVIITYV